ncbi:hypothetical protein MY04_0088 [Flammeovirga sp. MY04]|uniref:hypothetical protein n=1 Tax=Flammeovirga sp. MY04 TaxID=1191459 RepID=UPI0008061FF8|nr:hypothetical protein [Flammeovirga sp. MY04]ANQ47471.1 hypothetical protein MY04_0088 [Flammeovirga sp. MY04]
MKIIKATKETHYQEFLNHCPHQSVSKEYLKKNVTYILVLKGEVVGGYVFGNTYPYRYTEHITDKIDKQKMLHFTAYNNVTEITCMWIKPELKKSYISKFMWASIGYKGYFGNAEYYLFGTKSKKFAKVLNFPMSTKRFMSSNTDDRKKYHFFIADRKKTILGAFEIVMGLFIKKPNQELISE